MPFERRGRRIEEFLRCLKAAWCDEVVEFSGEFYEVPAARVEPKPVQRPHPPILLGGYVPATVRRAAAHADGYIGGNLPLSEVTPLIERLRTAAEEEGRAPDGLQIVGRGSVRLHDEPQGPDRRPLYGSLEEVREDVERYREAGLTELFLDLNFDERLASPESDPEAGMELARYLMSELAPGRLRT